jgi:hypothetical protein
MGKLGVTGRVSTEDHEKAQAMAGGAATGGCENGKEGSPVTGGRR